MEQIYQVEHKSTMDVHTLVPSSCLPRINRVTFSKWDRLFWPSSSVFLSVLLYKDIDMIMIRYLQPWNYSMRVNSWIKRLSIYKYTKIWKKASLKLWTNKREHQASLKLWTNKREHQAILGAVWFSF